MRHDCSNLQFLSICGEGNLLGNWKTPLTMDKVLRKDPITGKNEPFWEKVLYVHATNKKLKYRYVLTDYNIHHVIWERDPNRIADLVTLATKSPFKKYDGSPNQKHCQKFMRKQNKFMKYDCDFTAHFYYSQISEKIIIGKELAHYLIIYIGPYPQSFSDISVLVGQDVKAVLSLQSKEDIDIKSIDWDEIKKFYQKIGIKIMNMSVLDSDIHDIIDKAYDAAVLLNHLITKYGVQSLFSLIMS